ncbi:MAG TPA: hypothetical protein VN673_16250, partial [Clostridia bacterium]|nr:hypothetical protein [Clostridia bacterium]
RGGMGMVMRAPVFLHTAGRQETFSGFFAVTVPLPGVVSQAQLDELAKLGYRYIFFAPASAGRKPISISAAGGPIKNPIQQAVRARTQEFRLAIEPKGGWIQTGPWLLEAGLALLFSGLAGLLASTFQRDRQSHLELVQASQRLARETAEREQAQQALARALENATAAQKEISRLHACTQEDALIANELKAQLEAKTHSLEELQRTASASVRHAEQHALERQAQLENSLRTADQKYQTQRAELAAAHNALQQARNTTAELLARLDALTRAEQQSAAVSSTRLQQNAQTIAQLQTRLDHLSKSSAATIHTLEQTNRQLTARLAEAETAERRSVELTAQLEQARAALLPQQLESGNVPASVPESVDITEQEPEPAPPATSEPETHTPSESVADTTTAPEATEAEPESATELVSEPQRAEEATPPEANAAETSEVPANDAPVETPAQTPEIVPASEPETEPSPRAKTPKTTGRKRKRDNQMDLFGGPLPEPEPDKPIVSAGVPEQSLLSENEASAAQPSAEPGAVSSLPAEAPEPESPAEEPQAEPAIGQSPELPVLEGLATTTGLALAGGNTKLYLAALRHFAEQHATTPDTIREALEKGDPSAADRNLQDLQAAATEIGAVAVQTSAEALVHAIQAQPDPAELESLWADMNQNLRVLVAELKPASKPREPKSAPARRIPAATPVNPAELRKALGIIVPLLTDGDPGAKDCFKDNRSIFRSVFSADGYVEFEQALKTGEFATALDHLKKAAKRHGVPV